MAARREQDGVASAVEAAIWNLETAAKYLCDLLDCLTNRPISDQYLREVAMPAIAGAVERAVNMPVPSSLPRPPIQQEDPCIKTAGNASRPTIRHVFLQRERQEQYRLRQLQLAQQFQRQYLCQNPQHPLSIDIPDEAFMPGPQQQRPDLLIPATNAGPGIYQGGNSIDIFCPRTRPKSCS